MYTIITRNARRRVHKASPVDTTVDIAVRPGAPQRPTRRRRTVREIDDGYRARATLEMVASAAELNALISIHGLTQKAVGARANIDFRKVSKFIDCAIRHDQWVIMAPKLLAAANSLISKKQASKHIQPAMHTMEHTMEHTLEHTMECDAPNNATRCDDSNKSTHVNISTTTWSSIDIIDGNGVETQMMIRECHVNNGVYGTIYQYQDDTSCNYVVESRFIGDRFSHRKLTPLTYQPPCKIDNYDESDTWTGLELDIDSF